MMRMGMSIVIVTALAVLVLLAAVILSCSSAGAADEKIAATASWPGYGIF